MSTLRVAHFSDTHVLSLTGIGPGRFFNKRWTGAINLALNRHKHYRVEVFEQTLAAIKRTAPDHTVCTGDLANLALEPEFDRVRELLLATFAPDELTVVPGNHDYYVKEAAVGGWFERAFSEWLPRLDETGYPVTRAQAGLAVVGLNSAIPTPVFIANGRIGDAQLDRMESALRGAGEGAFRLLMVHHPLLPDPDRRSEAGRRLLDADALLQRLWRLGEAGPHLVIHGHNHAFKWQTAPGTQIPVIQVASASRHSKKRRAEFNVYVIEGQQLVDVERHIHDPQTGAFELCDAAGQPLGS